MLLGARQFWFRLKKNGSPTITVRLPFDYVPPPVFTLYSLISTLLTLLALMLAAFVVASALRGGFMLAAFVLRCALLVHHHLEARAMTEFAAKDSLLLIEREGLECSPFGIAFFLGHLALAFLTFMVAALVLAFAFLTHLGFLRHAFLDACLRCRDSCCLLRLIEVVPALESIDDAFYLGSVFGCHLMALRAVMMVALFLLVLAVAFALCVFFVFLVTLTVAA